MNLSYTGLLQCLLVLVLVTSRADSRSRRRMLDSPTCGYRKKGLEWKRIVGGTQSSPGAWPWQVALLLNGTQMCGGSLISPEWVVSASHCFVGSSLSANPRDWSVTLGEHHLKKDHWFEQSRRVRHIILHEGYQAEATKATGDQNILNNPPDNDVALLHLELPAILDDFVSPICMLPRGGGGFEAGKECYVSGWGHTQWKGPKPDVLREAKVKLVPLDVCNHEKSYEGAIHGRALCAGFEKGGVDACQFDSGGPLSCEHKGLWYLTGVVSWGHACAHPHKYGVYADMSVMNVWVEETIARHQAQLRGE